jgi:phosphotransferase system  glucose/maltose/N-acetylglucosamine-specific IIC component
MWTEIGTLLAWALLLVVQNAAFTMVSRARNSGSDWYHGIAAVFSNGIWFAAFYFTWNFLDAIKESGNTAYAMLIGGVYIAATVTGSVTMGKFLRRFIERGKRRVGHYDKPEEKR